MTKRRVIQVVVFLLLGAIVNVAVAWGCIYKYPYRPPVIWSNAEFDNTACNLLWGDGPGTSYVMAQKIPDDVVADFKIRTPSPQPNLPYWVSLSRVEHNLRYQDDVLINWVVESSGWPLRSLQSDYRRIHDGADYRDVDLIGGVTLSELQTGTIRRPRFLHIMPIWPGFAINAIFYAGVLWMVFAFPFVVRRYFRGRRIKRGLCPACAYPVGTSPVCTECGGKLPSPSR